MELYVSDTVLTTHRKGDVCFAHVKTWHKPRLTDGRRHPVRIIRQGEERKGKRIEKD